MKTSYDDLFKSTGNITSEQLEAQFGPLLSGELLLKFAEFKNFNAARAIFETWKPNAIIEMGNLIGQDYKEAINLYKTRDEFIAASFLKVLIDEWEDERQKEIRVRMADPVQQKIAADLLKIRLSGKLPHIDLAGTDFTVDWRLRQMRETELPWKHIGFDSLTEDELGETYSFFFNAEIHETYLPPDDIIELPKDVVLLEIPNELTLDPVAVAREHGTDLAQLLKEYPIQESLTAKIYPLSVSGLPEMIEINQRRQQRDASAMQRKRSR